MFSGLGRLRAAVVVAVILAVVAFPLGVLALTFGDVPPSHQFYGAINAISNAGITNGFPDGTYRPNDPVNRGQMAAFMQRGFSSSTAAYGGLSFEDAATLYVAEAALTSGGVGGGTGYVVVDADVSAFTPEAGLCPCEIEMWVDMWQGASLIDSSAPMYFDISDVATPTDYRSGAGSVGWTFAVPTSTTLTFAVAANIVSTGASASSDSGVSGTVTATYVPFGTRTVVSVTAASDNGTLRPHTDHARRLSE